MWPGQDVTVHLYTEVMEGPNKLLAPEKSCPMFHLTSSDHFYWQNPSIDQRKFVCLFLNKESILK